MESLVVDAFTRAGNARDVQHFKRTVDWVKHLKSDADQALLIAAIAHDIERVFRRGDYHAKFQHSPHGFRDAEHLARHQARGAEIIGDFLAQQGAAPALVDHVSELVGGHEIGGSIDQNVLRDADSVSFFENQVDYFVSQLAPKIGVEKV